MEIDFEKLFRNIAVENSLLVIGALSLLISIYNEYLLGIKLGFSFIIFGGIIRFYNLNIHKGILHNYMEKPRYRSDLRSYSDKWGKCVDIPGYDIPFKESWYIELIDFFCCLAILSLFVYIFNLIITGVL
jgi:hypothetical protein